jgi:hypothetical protein
MYAKHKPVTSPGKEVAMRKGRHRRHQQARDLKRGGLISVPPKRELCDECQRWPHAEWCMAEEWMEEEEGEEL